MREQRGTIIQNWVKNQQQIQQHLSLPLETNLDQGNQIHSNGFKEIQQHLNLSNNIYKNPTTKSNKNPDLVMKQSHNKVLGIFEQRWTSMGTIIPAFLP